MPKLLGVLLVSMVLFASACGDDGGGSDKPASTGSEPAAADVRFPAGEGKTMRGLREMAPEAAVFAPSVSVIQPGRSNRIGFALFDESRAMVAPDAVALYVSEPDGRRLRGPFEARRESLRVKPQFMSRQTQADLDDVDAFWVAKVPFPKRGRYVLTALVSTKGEMGSTSQFELRAGQQGGPPDVGEKAVKVNTDTVEDAGGNLESIDTRIPPLAELHEQDLADVLGKEPVVLAFATPQLCQTRVCGPIVDVVAQVKNEVGDDAGVTFIHQEIYNENDINKGFRPQVGAWSLPTEPWTFLVGRDGRVVERFEGALSVEELAAAVEKLRAG